MRKLFDPIWDDVDEGIPHLLAHYTSLSALESIVKNNEVWFSNPLLMNDHEEVLFGLQAGIQQFNQNKEFQGEFGSPRRYRLFRDAWDEVTQVYAENILFDTYVFCLTEHDMENEDGLLSMWRGYGGNGNGVALIFDASSLTVIDNSPLVSGRVMYATTEQRIEWIKNLVLYAASIFSTNQIDDSDIASTAGIIFERLKLFSLYTKHNGFSEEREWRIVYLPDRDIGNKLTPMLHYHNGPRGIEPKLKLKVRPIEGVTPPEVNLDELVYSILLGPSVSSAIAGASVVRMLNIMGRPRLAERVRSSGIPLRQMSPG